MEENKPEEVSIPEIVRDHISSEYLQVQFVRLLHDVASFVERYNILVPEVTVKVGPVSVTMTMSRVDKVVPAPTFDPKKTVVVDSLIDKVFSVLFSKRK